MSAMVSFFPPPALVPPDDESELLPQLKAKSRVSVATTLKSLRIIVCRFRGVIKEGRAGWVKMIDAQICPRLKPRLRLTQSVRARLAAVFDRHHGISLGTALADNAMS